jgi:CelD/BcsL family acetyltransferase involved in cellulose biosynthesis
VRISTMKQTRSALSGVAPLQYRVYSDLVEIQGLSGDWERLLKNSPCNRAFASLEWYIASCRLYKDAIPYVGVAIHNGEIAGILPLVLNLKNGEARFPHYSNDYNDAVSCSNRAALVAYLLYYTINCQRGCKKIILTGLRQDSNCSQAMSFLIANPNINYCCREINAYPYISLPDSFDTYLASRSRAFRKNIRRTLKSIEKNDLTIEELQPQIFDPVQLPELLISLASVRQKEKSFFRQPQAQIFVREVLPPLFARRSLCAFVIRRNEKIVGLDLCMMSARGLATWNGGFVDEIKDWSPGTALFAFGIKQAIGMKLAEYDFLEGKEAYKQSWANNSYVVSQVELTAKD